MEACTEFCCHSKILALHYLPRTVDTDQFVVSLVRLLVPNPFGQPADSIPFRLRSFPCFALRILTAHNLWRH